MLDTQFLLLANEELSRHLRLFKYDMTCDLISDHKVKKASLNKFGKAPFELRK